MRVVLPYHSSPAPYCSQFAFILIHAGGSRISFEIGTRSEDTLHAKQQIFEFFA